MKDIKNVGELRQVLSKAINGVLDATINPSAGSTVASLAGQMLRASGQQLALAKLCNGSPNIPFLAD